MDNKLTLETAAETADTFRAMRAEEKGAFVASLYPYLYKCAGRTLARFTFSGDYSQISDEAVGEAVVKLLSVEIQVSDADPDNRRARAFAGNVISNIVISMLRRATTRKDHEGKCEGHDSDEGEDQGNVQADLAPSHNPSPEQILISRERIEDMAETFAEMRDEGRITKIDEEIFRSLVTDGEIDDEEIAAACGTTANNVRVRKHRLVKALRAE